MALGRLHATREVFAARAQSPRRIDAALHGMWFHASSRPDRPRDSMTTSAAIPTCETGTQALSSPNATPKSFFPTEILLRAEMASSLGGSKRRAPHASPIAIANQ